MVRFDVLTLFPGMFAPVLAQSMLKRGQEKGLLSVQVHNLRDFTADRHKVVDDTPYGGGAGMVMKAEPILQAVAALRRDAQSQGEEVRLLFPTPHGRPLTQSYAQELATESRRIVILCGHYEGVDERVRLALEPEEISLGDYVLTGGELPALVLIDVATRLVPGVLGDPHSAVDESFSDSLLEYPQYTRPAEIDGIAVPEVLLSGHHEAIRLWRRKQALRSTYLRRPDLLRDRMFTREDRQLLDELMNEGLLTAPLSCEKEG
ncbi:MAG: tRNA (guanosine(37)-N1)-methyltransferase TrmD [Nitrospira sp. HN-bin3]|uniref:tRNA (guanosine(37)-N1)-methyltransferase TrmD n=1 Tax=Nitrospira cf. moscoviensis SBR1015 TaxID=96242 RepID=UPI000A09A890|nr:tRNA (guanosine(37)-N1)-methyltransferase TrmD [Nitrospira cf. moscoviensis SBR1015]MBH0208573.1 tRNA (guanosine(37)-N1)-methyltransferase TrmD [Nitrospira sp.]OQW39951.1 MAG: tRNA (guanosine(37)-N1)-methyltransferase TrmD [Nitrospira sp. HN-bin3]